MRSLLITHHLQIPLKYISEVMESRCGNPWKLSGFLNLTSGKMPSLVIVDTYQPSGQYHKEMMGSRGGSPWKLSDFFKFGV